MPTGPPMPIRSGRAARRQRRVRVDAGSGGCAVARPVAWRVGMRGGAMCGWSGGKEPYLPGGVVLGGDVQQRRRSPPGRSSAGGRASSAAARRRSRRSGGQPGQQRVHRDTGRGRAAARPRSPAPRRDAVRGDQRRLSDRSPAAAPTTPRARSADAGRPSASGVGEASSTSHARPAAGPGPGPATPVAAPARGSARPARRRASRDACRAGRTRARPRRRRPRSTRPGVASRPRRNGSSVDRSRDPPGGDRRLEPAGVGVPAGGQPPVGEQRAAQPWRRSVGHRRSSEQEVALGHGQLGGRGSARRPRRRCGP